MIIWTVVTESLKSRWTAFATPVANALEHITNPIGKAWQTITKPFRRGWLTVPIAFCALSSTVGLAVLALLIVSSVKGDFSGSTGLFAGNCSKAKRLSEILHFAVIAASFLVTFSSNKFLSLAVAPLPEEVSRAHARNKWLDIGINSWRNLQFVSRRRRWFWAIILLSSVPVQLLSNSALFLTTTSTNYRQVIVSQDFVEGELWQVPGIATLYYGTGWLSQDDTMTSMVKTIQQQIQNSNWTKMNTDECRKTYLTLPNGLQYYRNLVIVVEAGPDANAAGWTGAKVWNGSLPIYYTNISQSTYNPNALNTLWYLQPYCYYGICNGQMGYGGVSTLPQDYDFEPWKFQWVESYYTSGDLSAAPNFSPAYDAVTGLYCLAEPFDAPCKVEATNVFVLLLCLCIFIKNIVAIFLMVFLRDKKPIQCLGDMIQYQLMQRDDATMSGLCTFDQDWFRAYNPVEVAQNADRMRIPWTGQPRKWDGLEEKRWWKAVPRKIWLTTYILIAVVFAIASVLLVTGIDHNAYFGKGLLGESGFGRDVNNGRINLFGNKISSAIVANLPQSILTACYFWFTGIFTRIFQAREWALFVDKPHRLKVTDPSKPGQRSSYLLGAPLCWGALFIGFSIALHWSTGQSLYVVAKEVLPVDSNDFLATPLEFGLQFSTQAILLTLILAVVTVLIPIALSLRTLPENSIIVGSNSAAIAAQCQRPRGRTIGNYGTIRNDSAVADVSVEGGGGGEEEAPNGEVRRGSELQVVLHHQGEDSTSIIEMYEMYEMEGQQEGEDSLGEAEHSEQQDGEDGLRAVQTGRDEREQDETRGSRHHSRLREPSVSDSAHAYEPWLGKLQWGVLVSGSISPQNPGQLGLAAPIDIIDTPTDGHYYQ